MYNVKIKRIVENTRWNKLRSLEVATELVCKKVSNLEKNLWNIPAEEIFRNINEG